MLLERSNESVNRTSSKMARQDLTYFEGELCFYPLDLLASIFPDPSLSVFRGFLSSFEAFHTRIMFLREL